MDFSKLYDSCDSEVDYGTAKSLVFGLVQQTIELEEDDDNTYEVENLDRDDDDFGSCAQEEAMMSPCSSVAEASESVAHATASEDEAFDDSCSLDNEDEDVEMPEKEEALRYVNLAMAFAKSAILDGFNAVEEKVEVKFEQAEDDVVCDEDGDFAEDDGMSKSVSAVLASLESGGLEAAIDEAEDVRSTVRQRLMDALSDGRLETALGDTNAARPTEELRAMARLTLLQAASDGQLQAALESMTLVRQTEDVRKEARETLLEAVRDGRLAATLEDLRLQQEEKESRRAVREALNECFASGALESSIRGIMERRQVEEFRQEARAALLEGLATGALGQALASINAKREEEELRLEARASLTEGLASGALAQALAAVKAKREEEALKVEGRRIFIDAVFDGRLEAAVKEVREKSEKEELRVKAKSLLFQAATDGSLVSRLLEMKKNQEQMTKVIEVKPAATLSEVISVKPAPVQSALEVISVKPAPVEVVVEAPAVCVSVYAATRAVPSIEVEETEEPDSPKSPISPSGRASVRNRRRIIGGIQRAPSQTELVGAPRKKEAEYDILSAHIAQHQVAIARARASPSAMSLDLEEVAFSLPTRVQAPLAAVYSAKKLGKDFTLDKHTFSFNSSSKQVGSLSKAGSLMLGSSASMSHLGVASRAPIRSAMVTSSSMGRIPQWKGAGDVF